MSKYQKRPRRPGRRKPFRDPLPRILVLCEGKATERDYLNGFRSWGKNPRVRVEIASESGVDPLTLVTEARHRKQAAEQDARRQNDDNIIYESVWCVFDVDQHAHVAEARQAASQHGIELAISNPCFELWLILHFEDPPGPRTCKQLTQRLRKHDPGYGKRIDFQKYQDGYERAVKGARRLDAAADDGDDAGRNPTTGVYQLTETIGSADRSVAVHCTEIDGDTDAVMW
jgi:hypothetical protein